ncbi:MAG: AmmeMemoRadiSam system protein A [Deltaproteobacteria bacterium]|jgi:AmmeMemoRadiSam system protein A|nr:AmmeMemoRadiSam system protein A [Deltaproteobacteria bacterium]
MSSQLEPLPLELKKEILAWCREILAAKLNKKDIPPPPKDLGDRQGGVFVTLKKEQRLRGCIGRFVFDDLLETAISEMVLAAAFKDYRFTPLKKSELPDLDITVSILSPPEPLKSLADLVIGRDGLYLIHPKGRGVLLPVVAADYGFSPEEFARQTSIKAGLSPDAYKDPEAKLMVFTAPAFSTDPSEN